MAAGSPFAQCSAQERALTIQGSLWLVRDAFRGRSDGQHDLPSANASVSNAVCFSQRLLDVTTGGQQAASRRWAGLLVALCEELLTVTWACSSTSPQSTKEMLVTAGKRLQQALEVYARNTHAATHPASTAPQPIPGSQHLLLMRCLLVYTLARSWGMLIVACRQRGKLHYAQRNHSASQRSLAPLREALWAELPALPAAARCAAPAEMLSDASSEPALNAKHIFELLQMSYGVLPLLVPLEESPDSRAAPAAEPAEAAAAMPPCRDVTPPRLGGVFCAALTEASLAAQPSPLLDGSGAYRPWSDGQEQPALSSAGQWGAYLQYAESSLVATSIDLQPTSQGLPAGSLGMLLGLHLRAGSEAAQVEAWAFAEAAQARRHRDAPGSGGSEIPVYHDRSRPVGALGLPSARVSPGHPAFGRASVPGEGHTARHFASSASHTAARWLQRDGAAAQLTDAVLLPLLRCLSAPTTARRMGEVPAHWFSLPSGRPSPGAQRVSDHTASRHSSGTCAQRSRLPPPDEWETAERHPEETTPEHRPQVDDTGSDISGAIRNGRCRDRHDFRFVRRRHLFAREPSQASFCPRKPRRTRERPLDPSILARMAGHVLAQGAQSEDAAALGLLAALAACEQREQPPLLHLPAAAWPEPSRAGQSSSWPPPPSATAGWRERQPRVRRTTRLTEALCASYAGGVDDSDCGREAAVVFMGAALGGQATSRGEPAGSGREGASRAPPLAAQQTGREVIQLLWGLGVRVPVRLRLPQSQFAALSYIHWRCDDAIRALRVLSEAAAILTADAAAGRVDAEAPSARASASASAYSLQVDMAIAQAARSAEVALASVSGLITSAERLNLLPPTLAHRLLMRLRASAPAVPPAARAS